MRGAKESFILDDSYNASPRSLEAAFSTLQHFPVSGRRIVALGDMLELGGESLSAHQDVARMIFESGVSHAFLLGKEMRAAQEALLKKGFPSDHISFFENPDQLGEELVRFLEKGDTVLVKGSQGMRLEKAVEKILSESEKEMLLARVCRQSPDWKRTPFLPEKE
ncbi:MAG: hypothetical protein IPL87_03970 [Candidatus Moraniibacteriota bacterium]|nr:MAG: hypothetical protein IPL87_03970 [Candidatus Moranbacteria bacterium]